MTRILEIAKTHYTHLLKQVHEAGIEAISEQHWLTLKSTAELILNPKFAVFQVHQHIHKLKQKLPDKSAEFNAAPYREVIHWARLIQPNYRKKQAKTIECLNDPLWWHRCVENVKTLPIAQQEAAIKKLNEVQNRWHFQQAYAHYSTLDILHVYQTTIPVFTEWLHYAKTEWQQKADTLPPRLKEFYQNYLTWFEQALLEEKALLRNCLRERLAIGIRKGYGAWDDVIESLRDELEGVGVLSKSPKENSWIGGYLIPEIFVLINQIIEQDGSESEKKALHQLAYYPSFDNNPLFNQHEHQTLNHFHHQWQSRNDAMTFKSTLYAYLPRFLQRLFWDEEVRTQFFEHADYQFLRAQEAVFLEREIDTSNVTIATLLSHPTWQQSQLCLQLIGREMDRIKQRLQYPLAFFFPEIVDQLQTYQQSLKRSSDSWISKQLKLIQFVMVDKIISDLNAEDQSTLQSAFVNLRTIQEQGLCSESVKQQLAELQQHYQSSCQAAVPPVPPQTVVALPEKTIESPCDLLREAVLNVIASFEAKESTDNTAVQTLKNQLQAACSYDKTLLRICLLDYLKHASDLPRSLKRHLQTLLDKPEFSQSALNQSMSQLPTHQPTQNLSVATVTVAPKIALSTSDNKHSPLDEDPWNYSTEQLQSHCEALKRDAATATISWNQPLCQSVICLLKHIHALPWDDFVLHREKIALLLGTLAQISQKTLPALHQELHATAMLIPTLNFDDWNIFKKINIEIQIGALESFVKKEALSQEAASYRSQQAFAFLKPPSVRAEQKTDPAHVPPPIALPTNTL